MKNIYITIIVGIVLLSFVSAIYSEETLIYSGETFEKVFNYPIINCSIENNTYDLNGLNLTWVNKTATIQTQINYRPDNWTLVCLLNKSYYSSSGGGGSSKKIIALEKCIDTNWVCSVFPECEENKTVSRDCISNCNHSKTEYKFCGVSSFNGLTFDGLMDEIGTHSSNIKELIKKEREEQNFFKSIFFKIIDFFKSIFK